MKVTVSGPRRYVQRVESYRDDAGRVKTRTVATLGRIDRLDGRLDRVIDGLLKVAGPEPSVARGSMASVLAAHRVVEGARLL